ncbi:LuxR C-terminal-related transcriptional regulator [Sulfurimonas sp. NWX79]|uniref:response regulator transcription factor n=1 Tax=Sulfurimonas sp. NWX79 TaxID=2925412 RepID=UPI003204A56E
MQIIFFSANINRIEEWEKRDTDSKHFSFYDFESLQKHIDKFNNYIIIADYDSVAPEVNKMIASNQLPNKLIVLENAPEIVTGKMLISHGVKAYGNSRMLKVHYQQMIQSVADGKVWTYPELTAALAKTVKQEKLSDEAKELIEHRLTNKEKDVLFLVMEGLTNDAIANTLNITTRTVKAHISSIFSKLHVNDRLSLVLLLK